jgi:hypothetical protein
MTSDLDKITEIEDVDEAYNKFEEVMVNTDMPPNFCYFYLLKIYYVSSVFYKQHFSGFYS